MNDNTQTPITPQDNESSTSSRVESVADLKQRISELEDVLAKMTRQREESRRMIFELYDIAFPDDPPPTEAELLEERKTLTEISISQMIAELNMDVGANGQRRREPFVPFPRTK
jgi:hypothetical protein